MELKKSQRQERQVAHMERELVKIYDTSLRDGLRNSGISMSLEHKLRFAQQLERLNTVPNNL